MVIIDPIDIDTIHPEQPSKEHVVQSSCIGGYANDTKECYS
jgi:hypothetical protein